MVDASILYPDESSASETPSPPVKPPQTDEQDIASIMYPESAPKDTGAPQGNPYRLPGDDQADQLYGGTMTVELDTETDLTDFCTTQEEVEALTNNLGFIASEIGADQSSMTDLIDAARPYQLETMSDDDREASYTTGMADLRSEFGSDLDRKLQDACTLIATLPEIDDFLHKTGAGNDPVIIRHIIKLSESGRGQQRIRDYLTGFRKQI